jgi:hypothetical protein
MHGSELLQREIMRGIFGDEAMRDHLRAMEQLLKLIANCPNCPNYFDAQAFCFCL